MAAKIITKICLFIVQPWANMHFVSNQNKTKYSVCSHFLTGFNAGLEAYTSWKETVCCIKVSVSVLLSGCKILIFCTTQLSHCNLYLWKIYLYKSLLPILFGMSWFRMQTSDSFNQLIAYLRFRCVDLVSLWKGPGEGN